MTIQGDRKREHERVWGNYNSAPPNFQPCDQEEFWQWYSMHGFYAEREFRQFVIPDEPSPGPVRIMTGPKPMASVHLYYGAGNIGYGLVVEYGSDAPRYRPQYYKFFLCEHDVVHVATVANCLNEYRCKKCGWTYQVDSSG